MPFITQHLWLIWMIVINNYLSYQLMAIDHEIEEELPVNRKVLNIKNDIYKHFPNDILMDLEISMSSKYFKIDKNGNIMIKAKIDVDTLCRTESICCDTDVCKLKTPVYVSKPAQESKTYTYNFRILDINDNSPKFETSIESVKIFENEQIGSSISISSARDDDITMRNQIKYYTFVENTNTFQLEDHDILNLHLISKRQIDFETNHLFQGNLTACDSGNLCASRLIQIVVQDRNDNYPKFVKNQYIKDVPENIPIGKIILKVEAIDKDSPPYNDIKYSIVNSRQGMTNYRLVRRMFSLDSKTGELRLSRQLTAKAIQRYKFLISAIDSYDSSGRNKQITTVQLNIIDINDHAPKIELFDTTNVSENKLGNITIKIPENEPLKKLIALRVTDDDVNENANVTCSLMSNRDKLKINKRDENVYELKTLKLFDYEVQKEINTIISCRDRGLDNIQETNLFVKLLILDVNEFEPFFIDKNYQFNLFENKPPGENVFKITAQDKDGSAVLRYKIKETHKHRYFVINEKTGQIKTGLQNYDREHIEHDEITIVVTDSLYPPINSIEKTVSVTIKDINDNKPIFERDSLHFSIQENSQQKTQLNGQLKANDKDVDDNNKFIKFEIIKTITWNNTVLKPSIFKLNSQGHIYTIDTIDREVNPNFTLVVVAKDHGNPILTTTATVSIDILDENDNKPIWRTPIVNGGSTLRGLNISEYESEGTMIIHLEAYDPDKGNAGRVLYYIDKCCHDIFRLNKTTGLLTTAKSPLPINNYRLRLIAEDLGRPPLRTDLYLDVNVISKQFSEWNLVIIIGMIVVTMIIAMFLIIGIVCVKRRPNIMAMNSDHYLEASNMGTLKDVTNQSNILYPSSHNFLNDDTASIATNQNYAGSPLATTGFLTADPNNSAYLYLPNSQNYYITSSQLDLNNVQSRFPIGPTILSPGSLKAYETVNSDTGSQTGMSPNQQQPQQIITGIQTPNNLNSNIEIIPNSSTVLYRNNQNRGQFLPTNQHIVYTTSPGSSYHGTANNNVTSGSPEYVVGGDGESADSGKGASEIDFQRLQHHQHQMQLQQLQMQHNFMTGRNFMHSSSTLPHNTHLYKNQHQSNNQQPAHSINEPNYQTLTPYTYNNPQTPRQAHHPDILSSSSLSLTGQQQQQPNENPNSKFTINETTPLNKTGPIRIPQNYINMLPEYDDDNSNNPAPNIVPMTTFSTSYINSTNTLTSNAPQEITHINE